MWAKFHTVEVRLPEPEEDLFDFYPQRFRDGYRKASRISHERARQLAVLILNLLRHDASRIRSSAGWVDPEDIVKLMKKGGLKRAWAKLLHALSLLEQSEFHVMAVNVTDDPLAVGAQTKSWNKSFGRTEGGIFVGRNAAVPSGAGSGRLAPEHMIYNMNEFSVNESGTY